MIRFRYLATSDAGGPFNKLVFHFEVPEESFAGRLEDEAQSFIDDGTNKTCDELNAIYNVKLLPKYIFRYLRLFGA